MERAETDFTNSWPSPDKVCAGGVTVVRPHRTKLFVLLVLSRPAASLWHDAYNRMYTPTHLSYQQITRAVSCNSSARSLLLLTPRFLVTPSHPMVSYALDRSTYCTAMQDSHLPPPRPSARGARFLPPGLPPLRQGTNSIQHATENGRP